MKSEIANNCLIVTLAVLVIFGICFLIRGNTENDNEEKNSIDEPEVTDNRIFANNYERAEKMLETMTIDEKIGQLFLVRYPEYNQIEILEKYKFGGYIFFERDFKNKTEEEVKTEIENLQSKANIPLLISVDEEGGSVVRVSSNNNLSEERFKSPSEIYNVRWI